MRIAKTLLVSTIIVSQISSILAFADCPNAVVLHVGDKVTDCDRVGLSTGYEKSVRKDLIETDFNKKIIDEQTKIIDLKDLSIKQSNDQAMLWKTESDREREAYDKERARTNTSFWVGMGVGILVILGGAYAVKSVAR
jgi:hypothetical protein